MTEYSRNELEVALEVIKPFLAADAESNVKWRIDNHFKQLEEEQELLRKVASAMCMGAEQWEYVTLPEPEQATYLLLAKYAVEALRNLGWGEYID